MVFVFCFWHRISYTAPTGLNPIAFCLVSSGVVGVFGHSRLSSSIISRMWVLHRPLERFHPCSFKKNTFYLWALICVHVWGGQRTFERWFSYVSPGDWMWVTSVAWGHTLSPTEPSHWPTHDSIRLQLSYCCCRSLVHLVYKLNFLIIMHAHEEQYIQG